MIIFPEGIPVDGDDPAHIQWIYDKAKERADSFNIHGVTYRLTQGTSIRLCIKVGQGQGDGDVGTRVWGLGDARRGT